MTLSPRKWENAILLIWNFCKYTQKSLIILIFEKSRLIFKVRCFLNIFFYQNFGRIACFSLSFLKDLKLVLMRGANKILRPQNKPYWKYFYFQLYFYVLIYNDWVSVKFLDILLGSKGHETWGLKCSVKHCLTFSKVKSYADQMFFHSIIFLLIMHWLHGLLIFKICNEIYVASLNISRFMVFLLDS